MTKCDAPFRFWSDSKHFPHPYRLWWYIDCNMWSTCEQKRSGCLPQISISNSAIWLFYNVVQVKRWKANRSGPWTELWKWKQGLRRKSSNFLTFWCKNIPRQDCSMLLSCINLVHAAEYSHRHDLSFFSSIHFRFKCQPIQQDYKMGFIQCMRSIERVFSPLITIGM